MAGTWLKDGKQPPQAVLGIIEGYLHRVACPTYLGAVSLYIGWSLARTQEMMEFMQEQGIVVPLTDEEKRNDGIRIDANLWRLVAKPTPAKARW